MSQELTMSLTTKDGKTTGQFTMGQFDEAPSQIKG